MNLPKLELPKVEIKPTNGNSKDSELTKQIKNTIKDSGMTLWSYSRLSTFHNCKYEYYLGYVQKWIDEKGRTRYGKRGKENVYSLLGGIIHECLEGFIKGEYNRQDMIKKFELIYADSKVPKSDRIALLVFPSEKVEKNYIECIRIFLQNYEIPYADVLRTEDFLWNLFNNNKIAVQGYADCVLGFKDESGNKYAIIDDFKTSTKWQKNDILDKGRQLVMYAYMYTKRTGIPVNKVRWNMVKYYEVNFPVVIKLLKEKTAVELREFMLQNGVTKKLKKDEMIIEALKFDLKDFINTYDDSIVYLRNELYIKTHKEIRTLLTYCGIEEDIINDNLSRLEQFNTFNYFDQNIKDILNKFNFTAKDWYYEYDLTQEIFDEMENWIISTVNELERIPKELNESELNFFYPSFDVDKRPYYCTFLCGYAKDSEGNPSCKHYKKYLESFE